MQGQSIHQEEDQHHFFNIVKDTSKRNISQSPLKEQLQRSGCPLLIILKPVKFNSHLCVASPEQSHNCRDSPSAITLQAPSIGTIWVAGVATPAKEARDSSPRLLQLAPPGVSQCIPGPAVSPACPLSALRCSPNFEVIEQRLRLYAKGEWTLDDAEILTFFTLKSKLVNRSLQIQ